MYIIKCKPCKYMVPVVLKAFALPMQSSLIWLWCYSLTVYRTKIKKYCFNFLMVKIFQKTKQDTVYQKDLLKDYFKFKSINIILFLNSYSLATIFPQTNLWIKVELSDINYKMRIFEQKISNWSCLQARGFIVKATVNEESFTKEKICIFHAWIWNRKSFSLKFWYCPTVW